MMKLKKIKIFEKKEDFDETLYPGKEWDDDADYNLDDDDDDDDMGHLCYLLRQMIYNSGIDNYSVENIGLDISISVQFNRKEQLSYILKVFSIIKRIKKDILAQYVSEKSNEFEMWQTKSGDPVITFYFNYDDEDSYKQDYGDFPW